MLASEKENGGDYQLYLSSIADAPHRPTASLPRGLYRDGHRKGREPRYLCGERPEALVIADRRQRDG